MRDLIHEIDYALNLFGCPESISAVLEHTKELEIKAETSAKLKWRYPDFLLTMHLDYASPVARRHLVIHGELAVITWNVLGGSVTVQAPGEVKSQVLNFPHDLSKDRVLVKQLEALVSPARHPQLCSVEDALRAVAVCDAARESHEATAPTILLGPPWEDPCH